MRSSKRGRRALRAIRLEQVEPRLLLSADALGDAVLESLVETSLVDAFDLTGLSAVQVDYGLTGAGQTVVVIDSGIAYNHVALGGGYGEGYRVVGGYDFTEERDDDPYDDGPMGSHGTHVAGIIGSTDARHGGVAPGVDLVALRVFNDQGVGKFNWVEEALAWVHENLDRFDNPITTVNISLGANWNSDTLPDWAILEDELAQLEADGVFIAVAAGNRFTSYNTTGLAYPAVSSHVVPVASVDPDGSLSYYSQRDARVIAAPGRAVDSTVPDYRGNKNGIDDDFAKYSGTSMAAPYVAGASVLLREACQFVGLGNVDQTTLYDLMCQTADTLYDAVTGQNYHRLNLQRAIDAIMPDDDFGSTVDTAHRWGTLADTLALQGAITTTSDVDWFQFTAATSGAATFTLDTTHQLDAQWNAAELPEGWTIDDGNLSFDVLAGQTYTIGLSTGAGIGYYSIDASLAASTTVVELGAVAQNTFADQHATAAGAWYSIGATRDGILTVEALRAQDGSRLALEIYDASGRLLARSESGDAAPRVDVNVAAGQQLLVRAVASESPDEVSLDLRVTNLVSQTGATVRVLGTAGDDVFNFAAGATHRVTVNGVHYAFDASVASTIEFDGRGGNDAVLLAGTDGIETAALYDGSAAMRGSGYLVRADGVADVRIDGGGGLDTATLFDSSGDDTFVTTPTHSTLSGDGFVNRVDGFERVRAVATAGGLDIAHFYDSAGDDTFVATRDYGKLTGAGFYLRAEGFRELYAYATTGTDEAFLRDSASDDVYLATPTQSRLYGPGFRFQAEAFDRVHAYAIKGGHDVARLSGSAGDDVFGLNATDGRMFGENFDNRAKYFEEVYADAGAGGTDAALICAVGASDRLEASGSLARLRSEKLLGELYGFELVHARAAAGQRNTAEIAALDYVLKLLGTWDG